MVRCVADASEHLEDLEHQLHAYRSPLVASCPSTVADHQHERISSTVKNNVSVVAYIRDKIIYFIYLFVGFRLMGGGGAWEIECPHSSRKTLH
mmetsp:Transcript_15990/g.31256  ORF Transcript_15990/g.31256 Transcript_15990/m.31256 type:complete len:93 (-) Transcript_15990:304-582(-)